MKTASLIGILILTLFVTYAFGAEKVKLATAVRDFPGYNLLIMAAEERGFWRQNGLEVEWFPFAGAVPMNQAIATGGVKIGFTPNTSVISAVEKGLPILIVCELVDMSMVIWVRADSPIRTPRELKGTKIAVSQLGSMLHMYGRALLKVLKMEEKDVRFVGAGGLPAMAAALKSGAVDAAIIGLPPFADFKARGEFRDIGRVEDFIPVEWMDHVLFARKDFLKDNPDLVKRMVKAILQSVDFVRGNSQWAIEKLQKETGFTKEGARLAYEDLKYTRDGKVNLKELENVRNFMIEYGLASREKTPPVSELYTGGFTN